MRILCLTKEHEDSWFDRLIVGLHRTEYPLGGKLFLFPYKDLLHCGKDEVYQMSLPRTGNIDRAPEVAARLRDGEFDVVFFSYIQLEPWQHSLYEYIFDAVGDIPCVRIWNNHHPGAKDWPFRKLNVIASFYNYNIPGDGGFPIGYSELSERVGSADKLFDAFFAGSVKPTPGDERAAAIQCLQAAGYDMVYGLPYSRIYKEYIFMLRRSRVSFVLTKRYHVDRAYEGGAQGVCMLINKPLAPLIIRENFVDGESAIFFDGQEDLLTKLEAVLSDRDRCEAIGKAAQEHVLRHHLVQHSAKHVMDIVKEHI